MKLVRLSFKLHEIIRFGSRNGFHSNSYSTKAIPSHRSKGPSESSITTLYRRISPIGDSKVSVVPILDQWVEEQQSVDLVKLISIIRELRTYRRYSHALEISMWMTDKRFYELTSSHVAIRLDLISKAQGIEQTENYFNNLSQELKGLEVYGSLLNCYANAKCVEKAEALMQKMNDLGFAKKTLHYNAMLNLYYKTGNMEKFDALLQEMEENDIARDKFTLSVQLSAYAAVMDIERIDKIVRLMESDPKVVPDWASYNAAAAGYRKAGRVDKALEMLKKAEARVTSKRRCIPYNFLFTQYAEIGRKDEVLRLWSVYKKIGKVYNNGYICILNSLLKLDDFEMAEKIFDDWESQDLSHDMKIPNILIAAYSREGLLEKADALIDRVAISKGLQPNALTLYYLATGYLEKNQPQKAVEMMKRAIVLCETWRKPDSKYLAACLEYLREVGDIEQAEEFIKSLLDKGIISLGVQEALLDAIEADKPIQNGALL